MTIRKFFFLKKEKGAKKERKDIRASNTTGMVIASRPGSSCGVGISVKGNLQMYTPNHVVVCT